MRPGPPQFVASSYVHPESFELHDECRSNKSSVTHFAALQHCLADVRDATELRVASLWALVWWFLWVQLLPAVAGLDVVFMLALVGGSLTTNFIGLFVVAAEDSTNWFAVIFR